MKPIPSNVQAAKRLFRNAAKTFFNASPLKQVLFNKINRHERNTPIVTGKVSDFSDAKHYEKFVGHSTHFSSRNFI